MHRARTPLGVLPPGGGIYGLVTAAVGESVGVMWGEVSGLVVVLAVLMFRPEGLLGRRVEVKL